MSESEQKQSDDCETARQSRAGAAYALAAFGFWGGNPVYFKAVAQVPAVEVVAHRVIWSLLFLAGLLYWRGGWGRVRRVLADRAALLRLGLTTLLISGNWLIYIWAIASERVLETSLGYFINPLVNVLLGVLFLSERLNRWQGIAVLLAALGVVNLVLQVGVVPWVGLSLAFTFGVYGLLRKRLPMGPIEGLFVETLFMLPFALCFLAYLAATGGGAFGSEGRGLDLLLVLAGPVTALPLIWFNAAARRLNYATVGMFQYIAPSCQFLLAVFAYREPFGLAHLVTFACIWTALAIFSVNGLRTQKARPA